MVALITGLLEEKGQSPPIIIGGCALSYYSREVYFTSDIDLAYADRDALNIVLTDIGFEKKGRYWVSEGLKMAIEAPTSALVGEDSPIEIVEVGEGLQCRIIISQSPPFPNHLFPFTPSPVIGTKTTGITSVVSIFPDRLIIFFNSCV